MAFSTHFFKRLKWRRFLQQAVWLLLVLCCARVAAAEGIGVRNLELKLVDEAYHVNADFEIKLNRIQEDLLARGIPLNFQVEYRIVRPWRYWFDQTVVAGSHNLRLNYHAITRQYQLHLGRAHSSYATLAEARDALSRVQNWPIADRALLRRGVTYEAGVRMLLDVGQLPKPLQLSALASRDWLLASGWHHIEITP